MSRGHGRVQRLILKTLAGRPANKPVAMDDLAVLVDGGDGRTLSRSAWESTRRALTTLSGEGLVEFVQVNDGPQVRTDTTCPTCGHTESTWRAGGPPVVEVVSCRSDWVRLVQQADPDR